MNPPPDVLDQHELMRRTIRMWIDKDGMLHRWISMGDKQAVIGDRPVPPGFILMEGHAILEMRMGADMTDGNGHQLSRGALREAIEAVASFRRQEGLPPLRGAESAGTDFVFEL